MRFAEDLDRIDEHDPPARRWSGTSSSAGSRRSPRTTCRPRWRRSIRRYANIEIRNNTERFRYQSLTARYNTFNELWQKRLRAREEGKAFGVHGLRADHAPAAAAARGRRAARPRRAPRAAAAAARSG